MKPRFDLRLGRRRILEAGFATGAAVLAPKLFVSAIAQEDPRLKQAKAKGKVTWYTSMFPTEMRETLADKFQRNTGLELSIYGAGTNQVVARLRTERTAGSRNVDVIDGGDFDVFEDMIKDGFLKKYNPKGADAIHPDFKDSRGYYYGIYLWTLVLEYNTGALTKAAAPKDWVDLVDPRFKSKTATSDPASATAALGFCKVMATWKGWDWIEQFVRNDPLVLSVSSEVQPAVVRGERTVGIISSQFPSKSMEEGAPVALVDTDPLFPAPDWIAILNDAPNPDGAELFAEYLISKEAQDVVRTYGAYSCRVDVTNPFGLPPITNVKFKYKVPPTLDISSVQIAQKFTEMLRAAKQ